MQRYDFLTQQIDDCEARVMAEIERLTPPDDLPDGGAPDHAPGTTSETASSRSANAASNYTGKEGIQALALRGMMGVDLTAIPTIGPGTALVIASEIGPDFSAFPSAQHFCSWLALAPGTRISGGKNLPGKSPKAVNPVGQALRMAAMAARRSETFIGAKHRARLARMDTPVAIKATARELACLIYRRPEIMVTEQASRNTSSRASTPTRSGASTESSLISTAKPENSGSNSSRHRKTTKRKTQCRQLLRQLLLKSDGVDAPFRRHRNVPCWRCCQRQDPTSTVTHRFERSRVH